MIKQKISEYIAENYAGKGPAPATIVKRIEDPADPLQGVKEGGLWYVYLAPPSTGNERADKILSRLGAL